MILPPAFVLGASLLGLLLTLNAWRPIGRPFPIAVVAFFASWLTTELAGYHAALQAFVGVAALSLGAGAAWLRAAAAIVSFGSCLALIVLHLRSERARARVAAALREALGEDHAERVAPELGSWLRPASRWRLFFPFALGHADVETLRNVPFASVPRAPGGERITLRLDVHRHRAHPRRAPTLVYIHGGAWVLGFRERQGLPLLRHLAARGWVCFSIDYRLSPGATFPEHLVDVKRALAWVRAHADEYGADPDFVVACGNSAGAHLASLAALTPNDPRYQPGFEDAETSVAGCIGLYGVYDLFDRNGDARNGAMGHILERWVMKASKVAAPEAYAAGSPIDRIHPAAPPFLLIHGDRDTIAPARGSRRFAEALRAIASAPVAYVEVPDAQHAFEIFASPRAAHVVAGATSFLADVYSRHLEWRGREDAASAGRPRSGFVTRGEEGRPASLDRAV